jgi:hypothetical protein
MSAFAAPAFAAPAKGESVHILSTKRYIFYFKVEKNLIGATVEVVNSENKVVATEKVESTKKIIDFFYLAAGTYTVKIKKDAEVFSYTYENVQ